MKKYIENIDCTLFFPILMWLASRLLILIAMLLIAPLFPASSNGVAAKFSWDVFSAWDSVWYEKIATLGYDFHSDLNQISTVAFFPLFPILSHLAMTIGLPFKVAAILVNNLAFLSALILLYSWMKNLYGINAARWITNVIVWCPYSLYGTVIYAEGLFLLCTIAALRAFDKKQYISASLWGVLSTATRVPGIALIPAFLFISWKERRGVKAYICSLVVGLGISLYSIYCQIKFGDALAFIHAQKAWRHDAVGFDWAGWWKILMEVTISLANWKYGYIKDIWYPLLFSLIIMSGYLLWRFRLQVGLVRTRYSFYGLWLLLWLLTGDELFKLTMTFGGLYLLWLYRNEIPLVTVIYGFCSYILILNTGITASAERYVYGIVSLSIAFGLLLTRFPRFAQALIYFFGIVLAHFSVRFARALWVA